MSGEAAGHVKKPYQPPKLSMYGNLAQMTKTSPQNSGTMEMPTGMPKT
ncbi:MAG TPA: hypothetical protein VFF95_16830 [Candidatus Binatus sp.]|jgi:hypothetical protein|nr:hypothetical protein [Candidatus Binatus sp.]